MNRSRGNWRREWSRAIYRVNPVSFLQNHDPCQAGYATGNNNQNQFQADFNIGDKCKQNSFDKSIGDRCQNNAPDRCGFAQIVNGYSGK